MMDTVSLGMKNALGAATGQHHCGRPSIEIWHFQNDAITLASRTQAYHCNQGQLGSLLQFSKQTLVILLWPHPAASAEAEGESWVR